MPQLAQNMFFMPMEVAAHSGRPYILKIFPDFQVFITALLAFVLLFHIMRQKGCQHIMKAQ
jgi:hypothetical protein